ncbi:MAG: AEC family transporter [Tenericutes bacterium HGW-Tenericutes-6]|nr:MAG: AEC family transporter [Tenericutes bacterium HGW-Tenericutes-6]
MLDTFIFAANAVLPIVLIITLGYILKKIKFIDLHFINMLNKYVFRVGLPVLLFYNVYSIQSFDEIKWGVILFAVLAILIMFFVGWLSIFFTVKDPNQKGVILQAVIRSNFALIGIPLAQSLGGINALLIVSLLSAFTIPLANVLSVISLTIYQRNELGEKISKKKMIKSVVTNPLIIGVGLGLLVIFLRGLITPLGGTPIFTLKDDMKFGYDALRLIGQTATPMALIALGGQFEISVIKPLLSKIVLGVTWRNMIVPGVVLTLAVLLEDQITGMKDAYAALIALFGTPLAVSSAIMVHEMGGDEKLAGQLVIWSSIFSIITLFTIIMIFRGIGAL